MGRSAKNLWSPLLNQQVTGLTRVWGICWEVKGQVLERVLKVMTGAGETVIRWRVKALELGSNSNRMWSESAVLISPRYQCQ